MEKLYVVGMKPVLNVSFQWTVEDFSAWETLN